MKHQFLSIYALIPVLLVVAACAPTFDPGVLKTTKDLAERTDQLVAKADEPFTSHSAEVTKLRSDLQAASAAAHSASHNKRSAMNWEIMNDPERALAFGTLRRWESRSTLHTPYIAARRADIAEAFRLMICLEENKQAHKSCKKPDAAGGTNP